MRHTPSVGIEAAVLAFRLNNNEKMEETYDGFARNIAPGNGTSC
jgi:hypothetical protein